MRLALLAVFGFFAMPLAALDQAELDRRIYDLRTAELSLALPAEWQDHAGLVHYALIRHAFPFGTAINAKGLGIAGGKTPLPEADVAAYREVVSKHFSAMVCENEMKWSGMEKANGEHRDDRALAMVDFAEANGLTIRGHCLLWGVAHWLPDWQKKLPAEETEKRVHERFAHALALFNGRVAEWDLVNELMAEDIFARKMGWQQPDQYFAWARELAPTVRFGINEFKGLQDGTPEKIVAFAQSLRNRGVVLDQIGDQAHFFRPVPDADTLWKQLDVYLQCGIPLVITEFDLLYKDMSEADRAEQIERMVSVCFAHPAVHGFFLWGFWDGRHWRKNAGLWNQDWSPKPASETWMRCLHERWTSRGEAQPEQGVLHWRGYPGTYRIQVGEHQRTVRFVPGASPAWHVP